jgi:hypothetical protein
MSVVRLFVSSPDTHSERRFELSVTVGKLKVGPVKLLTDAG